MASITSYKTLFLFTITLIAFSNINRVMGASCKSSDIIIRQRKTGGTVEGHPEYEVSVINSCSCLQSKVILKCYGLSSVEPINAKAIKPVDDEVCVVGSGLPISKGKPIRFKYAWMTPQDFPVVSSQVHC